MHPFHYHPAFGMGFRRGPSRLVWFVIGAATSAWWIKRKDNDKRIFGHCMRPALPPPGSPVVSAPAPNAAEAMIPGAGEQPQQSAAMVRQWQWQWPQNASEVPQMVNNMPPAGPAMYPPTPGAWSQDAPYKWDQEREHFAKLSKQAADTVSTLTCRPFHLQSNKSCSCPDDRIDGIHPRFCTGYSRIFESGAYYV